MSSVPPDVQFLQPYMDAVAPYLNAHGYWAILFAVLLEDFGIPVPGETVLITGSVFAGRGDLQLRWVLAAGFTGAVAGDNIGYVIGAYAGRRFALRYGRFVFLSEERLKKLERFFDRHGGTVVILARFIEGLRQCNGIVAGLSAMPCSRFLVYNVVGAALWVGFWASLAYFSAEKLSTIIAVFKHIELYGIVTAGIFVLLFIGYHIYRRNKNHRHEKTAV